MSKSTSPAVLVDLVALSHVLLHMFGYLLFRDHPSGSARLSFKTRLVSGERLLQPFRQRTGHHHQEGLRQTPCKPGHEACPPSCHRLPCHMAFTLGRHRVAPASRDHACRVLRRQQAADDHRGHAAVHLRLRRQSGSLRRQSSAPQLPEWYMMLTLLCSRLT